MIKECAGVSRLESRRNEEKKEFKKVSEVLKGSRRKAK